jgi:enterochelin esterase family protein
MAPEIPHRPLPIDQPVVYAHGPDSLPQPSTPPGSTHEYEWRESTVYPGTSRKFWVHVPAGYDPARPANLMVFLDGWWYLAPDGDVRGGLVLDNLVHAGDLPMTIGLFVDPGVFEGAENPKHRNAEYDAFDDRLATFLITEIIPQVTRRHPIADDPERWGICGGSSGGDGAFTAAWLRPDRFRRAVCFLASFAQMPGGNPYPALIPATERKPLRIFLQAGHRDLGWNQPSRNWLAENLRTAAALAEAGYDFRLVLGDGAHSANHGGVLLPDALRWVWRTEDQARRRPVKRPAVSTTPESRRGPWHRRSRSTSRYADPGARDGTLPAGTAPRRSRCRKRADRLRRRSTGARRR